MSNEQGNLFLTDFNIKMLWGVILDDIRSSKNKEEIGEINNIFLNLAQEFYDKEKTTKTDLINMNKKFMTIMVKMFKPKVQEKVLVTAQEIQENKVNEFEKNLQKKQDDFNRSMAMPTPEKPNFQDTKDEPITELDLIIKKTISERNLELQKITDSFNKGEGEPWIKSKETSIRAEKTRDNEVASQNIKQGRPKSENMDISVGNGNGRRLKWADEENDVKLKITELDDTKQTDLERKIENIEKKVNDIYDILEKLNLKNEQINK